MDNFWLILSSAIIAGIGIVSIPLLPSKIKAFSNFLFVFLVAITTSIPAINALLGNPMEFTLPGSAFFGDIPLRIDALSAWFILIINLTCVNGAFYGIGYMKPYKERKANLSLHWTLFLIFQTSMLWVCMVQHSLAFLVAWEIMSLSSLFLVIFEHEKNETLKAGINYMVQMHIGVAFLTVAFIWVYFAQGSFDFLAISDYFGGNFNGWLFLLFFIGFGIKAGFIPLHSWLPHAHPAAPSHISGVMSGVIVKLGIYGIIRVALMLQSQLLLIGELLLIISIITGVFGILNASVHRDFKKMLAYCTIENIGIIGAGIGLFLIGAGFNNTMLMVIGLSGALLHTLNHSLFKSLLFFSVGSVYQQTHTRDMEKLGGLIHQMPQTASLFLIGSLAIGGLPPLNGFISEFLIYNGFLNGINTIGLAHSTLMILSLASLAFIGGLSLLTFTKTFGTVFLGNPRQELHNPPSEVSLWMRAPQYFIVVIMLSIGLFPQFYFSVSLQLIQSVLPSSGLIDLEAFAPMITLMGNVGRYSMLFLALLTGIYLLRNYFVGLRPSQKNTTWGCGYVAPNVHMQYTGKSFAKSLSKLLGFIVKEKKKYTEIEAGEIFPQTRKHTSHYADFFEDTFFKEATKRLLHLLDYFQFIQNGKVQMYVMYGLFFILLVFLGTIFNLI
jgi:formate hydrogenlyase subunit 3/multisubunit Na+/H+ antiporter MnhD subunit